MLKKHIQQIVQAKAAIKLLHSNITSLSNYSDIQTELNLFNELYSKDANENNQVPNKNILGFINYLKSENSKRELTTILKKEKKRRTSFKVSYKDYLSEYLLLRQRGYSNKAISAYSKKHFKTNVSKETIRKVLNNLEEEYDATQ